MTTEEQLAHALAVLHDAAEGGDKAAALYLKLVALQDDVVRLLRGLEFRISPRSTQSETCSCVIHAHSCPDGDLACYHRRECRLASTLRELGGEEERQRQVDLAHEAALAYTYTPTTVTGRWMSEPNIQQIGVDEAPGNVEVEHSLPLSGRPLTIFD